MNKSPLFEEFLPVSAKEWKQKIQVDLKGADYNETLVWQSPEGIKVKPFYHSDDIIPTPQSSRSGTDWKIGQSIYAGDAALANKRALNALKGGAESLLVKIPSEEVKINEVLKGIDLEKTAVYLDMGFLSATYFKSLVDFVGASSYENIYLNIDSIGQLARTGNWFFSLDSDVAIQSEILRGKFKNVLSIDMSLYQNSGADIVQQLAYGLAHANEYLNMHEIDDEKFSMHFKVSVGTNYFFEIAKLRALRLLWNALTDTYTIKSSCHISAIPTRRNKTIYDYNTNMLRTTTECMAAVLGGADMVSNLPYDAIYHKENKFGNRIALNQLLLLKNESYFDKTKNPAEGAYYIDSITNQLAEKALDLFKSIEKSGGFLKQLKAHTIQRKITETADKEQVRFEKGKEILIGTNAYQNENDKVKDMLELYPFLKKKSRKTLIEPILEKRLAENMEQKRLEDE